MLPCPFCSEKLSIIESVARSFDPPRIYKEIHHPKNDCYISGRLAYPGDDAAALLKWINAWNRRASMEGKVLVPREPTDAMLEAWAKIALERIRQRVMHGKDGPGLIEGIKESYHAMIAAAPSYAAETEEKP